MPLTERQFRENRCSSSNVVLRGVKEVFSYFLHFYTIWNGICTGDVLEYLLSDCKFRENRNLHEDLNEFLTVISRFR
jgi:hypothetical protein